MSTIGTILLADDEETFRESTSRLLRRRGFACESAPDSDQAIARLQTSCFDLLISDIRMPRNPDLRLVHAARELDEQMAIILVTGYPSVDTAIRSVEMSVAAYLTKPLDMDDLARRAQEAIRHSQRRRAMSAVAEQLRSVLKDIESLVGQTSARDRSAGEVPLETIRILATCLSRLLHLAARSAQARGITNLCELLDCPQQPVHRQAIQQTIEVLRRTKNDFKSKALAELRIQLEELIEAP